MTRLPDWHSRLTEHLKLVAAMPFNSGQADCALFAAGCIEAMTGTDYAADFKGRYTTHEGGIKRLRQAGYRDLGELAADHLEEIPVAFARTGDLAVLESGGGPALGIVQGERVYVRSPERLATLSLLQAQRAFRV